MTEVCLPSFGIVLNIMVEICDCNQHPRHNHHYQNNCFIVNLNFIDDVNVVDDNNNDSSFIL